jgi:hypothetical protein
VPLSRGELAIDRQRIVGDLGVPGSWWQLRTVSLSVFAMDN